jgi:hypothetical protein
MYSVLLTLTNIRCMIAFMNETSYDKNLLSVAPEPRSHDRARFELSSDDYEYWLELYDQAVVQQGTYTSVVYDVREEENFNTAVDVCARNYADYYLFDQSQVTSQAELNVEPNNSPYQLPPEYGGFENSTPVVGVNVHPGIVPEPQAELEPEADPDHKTSEGRLEIMTNMVAYRTKLAELSKQRAGRIKRGNGKASAEVEAEAQEFSEIGGEYKHFKELYLKGVVHEAEEENFTNKHPVELLYDARDLEAHLLSLEIDSLVKEKQTNWFTEKMSADTRTKKVGKAALLALGCAGASFLSAKGIVSLTDTENAGIPASGIIAGLGVRSVINSGRTLLTNRVRRLEKHRIGALVEFVEYPDLTQEASSLVSSLSGEFVDNLNRYIEGQQSENIKEARKLAGTVIVSSIFGYAASHIAHTVMNYRHNRDIIKQAAEGVVEKVQGAKAVKQTASTIVKSTVSPTTVAPKVPSSLPETSAPRTSVTPSRPSIFEKPTSLPRPTIVEVTPTKPSAGPAIPKPTGAPTTTGVPKSPATTKGVLTPSTPNLLTTPNIVTASPEIANITPVNGGGILSTMKRVAEQANPGKKVSAKDIAKAYYNNSKFWQSEMGAKYMPKIKGFGLFKDKTIPLSKAALARLRF